jgi:hypothetical protein
MYESYLVFLLPLWFGWILMGRYRKAAAARRGGRELVLSLMCILALAVVTPALKLWLVPPLTIGERIPLALVFAEVSLALMFVGVILETVSYRIARKEEREKYDRGEGTGY